VAEYDQTHPSVQVSVVGNISDTKIVAAIRAGNAPDVASSFNSYDVGVYCGTGGWIDLAPLMKQSGINANVIPGAARNYTKYNGTRCALPLLADAYGLYYNNRLFKAPASRIRRARSRADRGREEADEIQLRRLDQGARLRSVHGVLRERPGARARPSAPNGQRIGALDLSPSGLVEVHEGKVWSTGSATISSFGFKQAWVTSSSSNAFEAGSSR
jgi:hypothetical protein